MSGDPRYRADGAAFAGPVVRVVCDDMAGRAANGEPWHARGPRNVATFLRSPVGADGAPVWVELPPVTAKGKRAARVRGRSLDQWRQVRRETERGRGDLRGYVWSCPCGLRHTVWADDAAPVFDALVARGVERLTLREAREWIPAAEDTPRP